MKLLVLAPQPFFQERGTPIAVRLALKVLTERIAVHSDSINSGAIDLVTYGEGHAVNIPGVNILRIPSPTLLRGVGPGISFKKLALDVIFLLYVLRLVWSRRRDQYGLVHAVEESAFIALLLRALFGIPYIYDMDSSLALQLTEKWYLLRPLYPIFAGLERIVIRSSTAVVPVCDALAAIAERHGSRFTSVLSDISLLDEQQCDAASDLRTELGLGPEALLVLYVGNLEPYQGVDLLIHAFSVAAPRAKSAHLIVIGGRDEHVALYRRTASGLGLDGRVHLTGPRPLAQLNHYIKQADILASPRIRGNNTPMKIYSYLHSGKALIATRLPTHTQALSDEVALLAEPQPDTFGASLLRLLEDQVLRQRLGAAARALADEKYTFNVFKDKLNSIYDTILGPATESSTAATLRH